MQLILDGVPVGEIHHGSVRFGSKEQEEIPPLPVIPNTLTFEMRCHPTKEMKDFFAAILPNLREKSLRRDLTFIYHTPRWAAQSWESRRGRWLYGCRELGPRYWTASRTALERRRVRSRIHCYNCANTPVESYRTTVQGVDLVEAHT